MQNSIHHAGWAFYTGLLDALTYVMGSAKGYLRDHGPRVAHLSRQLARGMGLGENQVSDLLFAGVLADVGMIGLVEEAWENPRPQLGADARARVALYPARSAAIVLAIPHLSRLAPLVRHHHEWWNGGGYPDGLSADNIPFGAQILRIADTVCALGEWRPQRDAMPPAEINRIVREGRGQEFAPEVADAYLSMADDSDLVLFHPNVFHRLLIRASSAILPEEVSPLSSDQLLDILASLIDAKDPYTAGHSKRVAALSLAVADQISLDEHVRATVWSAAYLHDIGKVSVPLRILAKNGPLDDDEFASVKAHTSNGAGILEEIPTLRQLAPGARYHHEKWDGSGYPEGISQSRIPLVAQILAVADAYDAMTSKRSYRDGRSHQDAMEEIDKCTGRHFGPETARAFLSLPDDLFGTVKHAGRASADPFRHSELWTAGETSSPDEAEVEDASTVGAGEGGQQRAG